MRSWTGSLADEQARSEIPSSLAGMSGSVSSESKAETNGE
jgi:hypothetical protein